MKRWLCFFFVFQLLSLGFAMAQDTDSIPALRKPQSNSKFHFGFGVQSQFSTFGHYGNSWGNWFIPSFNYDNNKWHWEGVVAFGNIQNNGSMFADMNRVQSSSPLNNVSFYTHGMYQINSKLAVHTVVYRDASQTFLPQANPRAFDYSTTGVGIGFSYKFSDNISFDAAFQFRNSNNPYSYYNNRYGSSYWGGSNSASPWSSYGEIW
jgi:hypothetical protein